MVGEYRRMALGFLLFRWVRGQPCETAKPKFRLKNNQIGSMVRYLPHGTTLALACCLLGRRNPDVMRDLVSREWPDGKLQVHGFLILLSR